MTRRKSRLAGKKGKRKPTGPDGGERPRRGLRRSIRYDAVDEPGEGRGEPRPAETLNLRHLKLDEALVLLETQLRRWSEQGRLEALVIHGKGRSSPGGVPVLGPAVRRWCQDNHWLVKSWREAPAAWGGVGALVVTLRRPPTKERR